MRPSKSFLQTAAALLALTLLCGCGKKGRLYLPDEQQTAAPAAPAASVALSAAARS